MTTVKQMTFAALLRRYRRALRLTQEGLAERAGLSVNAVSALERGVNVAPRKDTVEMLADALHLSDADRTAFEAAARGRTAQGTAFSTLRMAPGEGETPASSLPLVGRAKEVALLRRRLAAGDRVAPALLVLAGEPGIGKSRLLVEAATMARAGGWTILVGRCHRRGGQEPYEPLLRRAGKLHPARACGRAA